MNTTNYSVVPMSAVRVVVNEENFDVCASCRHLSSDHDTPFYNEILQKHFRYCWICLGICGFQIGRK